MSEKLFDGDKQTVVDMTEKCLAKSYVEVDLSARYDIHYVIVFGGEGGDYLQNDFYFALRNRVGPHDV